MTARLAPVEASQEANWREVVTAKRGVSSVMRLGEASVAVCSERLGCEREPDITPPAIRREATKRLLPPLQGRATLEAKVRVSDLTRRQGRACAEEVI